LCYQVDNTRGNRVGRIIVDDALVIHFLRDKLGQRRQLRIHVETTTIPVDERGGFRRCQIRLHRRVNISLYVVQNVDCH